MNDISLAHSGTLGHATERLEDDWIERPGIDRFEQAAARYGDKVAVDDGVTRLTYCELRRAVLHLAQHIAAVVPIGGPVGILLPNSARFPIAALACLAARRPYVPIDPTYPADRNEQLVREAGLSAAIVDGTQANMPYVPTSIPHLNIANSLKEAGDPKLTIASGDGPAVILYTSGSTGQPKGICFDQRVILERVAQATFAKRLCSDDRVFVLSSPSTINGVRIPLAALLNGATLYCADPQRIGIDGVLRFLQDARPTVGYVVAPLLRTFLGSPGATQAFSCARIIRTGGDVLLKNDLTLWRSALPRACRIYITLASTEMPTVFHWFVPPEWEANGPRLPVGYPRSGVSFELVDDNDAPVPVGEAGELVIKSPYLPLGVWQDGRLQPGPFQKDPDNPAVRILKIGDLVRMREDGLAEMVGRKDRRLKIRGFRIEPGDVENALRGCPGVVDVAVIARRKGEEVASLVAYVVPRDPADVSLGEELKKQLAMRLPPHMRPSQIRFIDRIPQLPGFKTDITALEKLDEKQRATIDAAAAVRSYVAPRTPTEETLAGIWCKVLELKQVGVHDNFFELGGNSLLLARLANETNRTLKTSITAPQVIQNPTVEQLAKLIVGQEPGARRVPQVIQLQEGEAGVPIYLINAGPDEFRLARMMGDRPVFGIELPWPLEWRRAAAKNRTSALPSMEQLVAPYFAALSAHAGSSPCVLAGHSMAGLIAFETAHLFTEHGGKVEMVMLFDSSTNQTPSAYEAARHRCRQIWQRTPNGMPTDQYAESLGRRLKAFWLPLRWMLGRQRVWLWTRARIRHALTSKDGALTTLPDEMGMPIQLELLMRLNTNARKSWRPRCLESRGVLFRASDPYSEFYNAVDGSKGWTGLFRQGLEIIPVKGDHLSMIRDERNHPTLAKAIERALMQLQGATSAAVIPEHGRQELFSTEKEDSCEKHALSH